MTRTCFPDDMVMPYFCNRVPLNISHILTFGSWCNPNFGFYIWVTKGNVVS